MFIIRKRLDEEIVVGSTRYDETCECVQIWNGESWVDDPASDPRNNSGLNLPPPTADDVRCAAAAGMVEALRQGIEVMDGASDILGMANALFFAIVAFFPIGVLASVLLALAGLALTIGLSTLLSLFDEEGLETIRDLLYCLLDENGRISQADFDQLPALVDEALASDIAGAWMQAWLAPLGVVGLNRAGVTFADPEADCSGAQCAWCYEWVSQAELLAEGWNHVYDTGISDYWVTSAEFVATAAEFAWTWNGIGGEGGGTGNGTHIWGNSTPGVNTLIDESPLSAANNPTAWEDPAGVNCDGFFFGLNAEASSAGDVSAVSLKISGKGVMPEWTHGHEC